MAVPSRPPSVPGHWLLGNLPEFRRDMLGFFTRCARQYGDLVALRLGPRKVNLASHPDFVEQVLVAENRKFGKSYVFELLRPVLGNGLVTSEGEFWLRQRRLVQPAFTKSSVNSYAGIMIDYTKRLLDQWQKRISEPSSSERGQGDGKRIDVHREMTRLTLGIVGKSLMDIDLTDDVSNEVAAPLEQAFEDFSARFESVWNPPQWMPTPRNRRGKRNVRQLDTVVNRIIQSHRAVGGERGDLLSKLIHARDEVDQTGMTDRQLRDEVMTLFLAGHETTANALAWTWFLLGQNPAAENRLVEELSTVLGDRFPNAADMPKLIYTEAVIKESMRLFPPAFAFSRRVLADATIGGFHVPAGTAVIMSQWVIHRDPRWWNDADKFLPERWLNEDTKQRPAYAYFPFGAGPRGCIGNTFAMLEAILVVASIAPRFRIELVKPENVKPWPSVTLRPRGGIAAVLHSRKPQTVSTAGATRPI